MSGIVQVSWSIGIPRLEALRSRSVQIDSARGEGVTTVIASNHEPFGV